MQIFRQLVRAKEIHSILNLDKIKSELINYGVLEEVCKYLITKEKEIQILIEDDKLTKNKVENFIVRTALELAGTVGQMVEILEHSDGSENNGEEINGPEKAHSRNQGIWAIYTNHEVLEKVEKDVLKNLNKLIDYSPHAKLKQIRTILARADKAFEKFAQSGHFDLNEFSGVLKDISGFGKIPEVNYVVQKGQDFVKLASSGNLNAEEAKKFMETYAKENAGIFAQALSNANHKIAVEEEKEKKKNCYTECHRFGCYEVC